MVDGPCGWQAAGATTARVMTVYRAVLNSVCQMVLMPRPSGPASGVHAIANAQAAISPPIPAEAATVRQNRLAGPGCGSAPAQASPTAMAIPAQNQISSGGSVPSNQYAGRGCWSSTVKPKEDAASTVRPASSRRARRGTPGSPGGLPRQANQVSAAASSGSTR